MLIRKGIKIFLEKLKKVKNYLHFLLKNGTIFILSSTLFLLILLSYDKFNLAMISWHLEVDVVALRRGLSLLLSEKSDNILFS